MDLFNKNQNAEAMCKKLRVLELVERPKQRSRVCPQLWVSVWSSADTHRAPIVCPNQRSEIVRGGTCVIGRGPVVVP